MRRTLLWLLLATVACISPVTALAQTPAQTGHSNGYYVSKPLRTTDPNFDVVHASMASATTIPMWDYNITSTLDGVQYSGTMVGRSPFFHGGRTTDIPAIIIPVKLVMPDGGVFDPTAADATCSPSGTALTLTQGSPVLQSAPFTMGGTNIGTTQYPDAFQRANFWANVSVTGDRYHTMLSPVNTLAAVTATVPSGSGITKSAKTLGGCGNVGVMDINWWDAHAVNTILPSLAGQGVGPTTLPIFVFYNVVMTQGTPSLTGPTCCILGYHSAAGFPVQTYSQFDFDKTQLFPPDVTSMSHEIAEWMDDPIGTNVTPIWGKIGQVAGCQNSLEVGDPLSGTAFPSVHMPNGYTYGLQELAFYSWFFRQSPSIGLHGWYSDNGTFTTGAGPLCM